MEDEPRARAEAAPRDPHEVEQARDREESRAAVPARHGRSLGSQRGADRGGRRRAEAESEPGPGTVRFAPQLSVPTRASGDFDRPSSHRIAEQVGLRTHFPHISSAFPADFGDPSKEMNLEQEVTSFPG